jgi:Uma2 family endonuclease
MSTRLRLDTTRDGHPIVVPDALVVTPEQYDALPPSSRIELVDGVVHVMSPPTLRHQRVVDHLLRALTERCPAQWAALREQEIRLAADHRRNPDVLVIKASALDLDRTSYQPHDVLLAVEVVSPGTRTTDRRHKPVEYADAGIPHYWRVEPLPTLTVHTYRLDETDIYEPTGIFTGDDTIDAPGLGWAKVPMIELAP